jgi:Arc/MetJ family transcription regulator
MRTNIVIDDELMKKALVLSKLKTKREVVHKALEGYIRDLQIRDLRDVRGKIRFAPGYDHKASRPR